MPNNITSGPVLGLNATAVEANGSFEVEAIYSWIKSLFIHKYQHILLPYVNITRSSYLITALAPLSCSPNYLFFSLLLFFFYLFPYL